MKVITVTDINDNAPVADVSALSLEITENQSVGTVAARTTAPLESFSASDADEPGTPNSQLTFTLNNAAAVPFAVNPATGRVTATQTLDREASPQYTLSITVSDAGSPQQTATFSVTVAVVDQNDNSPAVTSDAGTSVVVDENVGGVLFLP